MSSRHLLNKLQSVAARPASPLAGAIALLGCLLVAAILHEPIRRTHDEFSYALMGETLAHGHVSNPVPPLTEFFDTFHVLMHPVYASKYFPAQGLFLALGEKLTGHPAVGLWLSSALACGAITWMLQGWISPGWGLLGGFVMVVQYGIFSYWSQTYWGGMVPALGGALFFGAIRRLGDRFSWQNSIWLSLGLLILANSRPLEGLLAVLPAIGLFIHRLWRNRRWQETGFWPRLVLPTVLVLTPGAIAMGNYNHAITGSALSTPYVLHERQYQETPLLLFLPLRPKLTYSGPMLRYYYEVNEMRPYLSQRIPKLWPLAVGRKIATWWDFYCGILLSIPLFLPPLLRRGKTRVFQIIFLAGFFALPFVSGNAIAWRILIDLLAVLEVGVLWFVFSEFLSRLAIATCTLILVELFFTKWSFPHYFAPAACLVLYLQIEGLRRIWNWNPQQEQAERPLSRKERRRLGREHESGRRPAFNLRALVYFLPVACVISLVLRVEGRLNGWNDDPHGPDRQTLLLDDWSIRRADLDHWLEQQPMPQLVFVRYSPYHNLNFEWVYNHADIMHSHVIWARDLGAKHNKLLLDLMQDRKIWLVEADHRDPRLIPYSDSIPSAPMLREPSGPPPDQD
jgi:hypothetical protein